MGIEAEIEGFDIGTDIFQFFDNKQENRNRKISWKLSQCKSVKHRRKGRLWFFRRPLLF